MTTCEACGQELTDTDGKIECGGEGEGVCAARAVGAFVGTVIRTRCAIDFFPDFAIRAGAMGEVDEITRPGRHAPGIAAIWITFPWSAIGVDTPEQWQIDMWGHPEDPDSVLVGFTDDRLYDFPEQFEVA
jgi:hypothetical protein